MGMPFLSRIWLNPMRSGAQRVLRSPQAMHAAVLQGLPVAEAQERVLWRLDADGPHRLALYVVTPETRPSWEHLVEQAGWASASEPQAEVREYRGLLDSLALGQEFAFRLTANPTSSTRNPEKPTSAQGRRAVEGTLPRSTRVGHRTARAQLDWFLTRACNGSWGFEVPDVGLGPEWGPQYDVRIAGRERKVFRRRSSGGGKGQVTLQIVTYEGRLLVADAAKLREVLVSGIGPAKAYGCGLLTLAPSGARTQP